MAKVYVSSTVLDLKAERQAVIDWLIAADHQPVHSYRPDSETVRESCLDDIDRCDLYVLLLGSRYGFQPDDGNPEHLSITHLEFRRAGTSNIPRLALLRTSVPDLNQSDLLDPVRSALWKAFADEVRRTVRPGEFTDLKGLIDGLSTGVPHVLSTRAASAAATAGSDERVVRILATIVDEKSAENEALRGRVAALESQLKSAISRTLSVAARPEAGDAEQSAVSALESGDCGPAGALLAIEEEREAAKLATAGAGAEGEQRRTVAALAREQGALASTRDVHQALTAFERAATYDPDDVWTMYLTGDLHIRLGNLAAAMRAFRRGQLVAEGLAATRPDDPKLQRELALGHTRIGDVRFAQGDLAGALDAHRAGLAIAERLASAEPANAERQRDVSVAHNRIGDVLLEMRQTSDALASFMRGSLIADTLAESDPSNTLWQRDLSVSHNKIGEALFAQGDRDDALLAYRQSLALAKALAARDPWNREWQRDVSISHNNVGDVLLAQGDLDGALAEFQQSLTIRSDLAAQDPGNADWQRDLSFCLSRLADIYEHEGHPGTALEFAVRSLDVDERLAALDPTNVTWQRDVAYSRQQVERLKAATAAAAAAGADAATASGPLPQAPPSMLDTEQPS